jgi:hypothetical protein
MKKKTYLLMPSGQVCALAIGKKQNSQGKALVIFAFNIEEARITAKEFLQNELSNFPGIAKSWSL